MLRASARRLVPNLRPGVRKFSNQNATAHKRQAFEANDHEHNPEKHRAMWQNVSFGMIALSGVLTAVTFKNHFAHAGHEKHEPPAYEYRDIKNKQFPWGAESLFTAKK